MNKKIKKFLQEVLSADSVFYDYENDYRVLRLNMPNGDIITKNSKTYGDAIHYKYYSLAYITHGNQTENKGITDFGMLMLKQDANSHPFNKNKKHAVIDSIEDVELVKSYIENNFDYRTVKDREIDGYIAQFEYKWDACGCGNKYCHLFGNPEYPYDYMPFPYYNKEEHDKFINYIKYCVKSK